MLTAETTYNVIQALPSNELDRLYKLLGVSVEVKESVTKVEEQMFSNIDVRDDLMRRLNKIKAKNIKKYKQATVAS